MDALFNDTRHAARALAKSPGFTLAAILTLAIGLGANIAIFSLINGLLLRPLPYPDSARLVSLVQQHPRGGVRAISPSKYQFWSEHATRTFSGIAAYDQVGSGLNLSTAGNPERVTTSKVSANFFTVLGSSLAAGRGFLPGEDRLGAPRTVVISHALWQRRFEARADIVGRQVMLDGQPYTVVGVAAPEFRFPASADLWTPLEINPAGTDRTGILNAVGRLRNGHTLNAAQSEMDVVWRQHMALDDEDGLNKGRVNVASLQTTLFGQLRPALMVLFAAVGMVLLIACVNTANLQLARAAGRRQAIAVRAALGASPWQVMRPMLVESVLLSLAGGVAGLLLALASMRPLLALSPAGSSPVTTLHLDGRVFAFSAVLSLLVGVLSALPSALRMCRGDVQGELKQASGRTASPARSRMGKALVVAEMALAVALLVGAGLLVRGFLSLRAVDPGFDPRNVMTLKMSLPAARYGDIDAYTRFTSGVLERLRALPGVETAAFAGSLPLEPGPDMSFTIEGRYTGGGLSAPGVGVAQSRLVTSGFFQSLRIPLRRGRLFTDRDNRSAQLVAVINETAARRYWPDGNAIGQHITLGQPYAPQFGDARPREIIGIVADVKEQGLDHRTPAIVYTPASQVNAALWGLIVRLLPVSLVVRSSVDTPGLIASVERTIWAADPEQAAANVQSMEQIVVASLGSERFNALLLGILAAMALLLAAIGVGGVLSSLVRARWREFAVRMALGATRADVLRLVLGYGLRLAAIGAVAGLAGGAVLGRVLASQLQAVNAKDWLVFAASPLALLLISVVAAALPAVLATRSNPNAVLRSE